MSSCGTSNFGRSTPYTAHIIVLVPADRPDVSSKGNTMISTRGLPPCRGIMSVDTVGFSRNPSSRQPDLSASIPGLLARTFERCDQPKIWAERRFAQGTGDGFLFGVAHEVTPYLIDPFIDRLQEVLEEENRSLQAQSRDLRLRLRLAVHMGNVPDEGDLRDGIGTPTNDTCRLLDSGAIKQVIEKSNPDVTLVAAIVSQRIYEDVVRAGHTEDLHPDRFEPVIAEVPGKDFAQPAWIYVPKRSRREHPEPETSASAVPASAQGSTTTINGDVGNSISGGNIHGDVRQGWGRS